jgi:preprotein translocase subunit SecA
VAREREVQNVGARRRSPVRNTKKKIGRNDPCPCGKLRPNGLPMKYKNCCGRLPGVQGESDN